MRFQEVKRQIVGFWLKHKGMMLMPSAEIGETWNLPRRTF